MSTKLMINNSLMNIQNYNQEVNSQLLYFHCMNQKTQQYQMNSMNNLYNSYQYQVNMAFNNQKFFPMTNSSLFFDQNRNNYSQFYPNYFSRNNCLSKSNYYYQKKNKNKRFVSPLHQKEALAENTKKNYFKEKKPRKDSLNSISTYSTTITNNTTEENEKKEKYEINQEKETLNELNNKNEKKEDEDFYEINEDNTTNTRRFSQRSKRSNDSYESNCSNSTSDLSDEASKVNIKRDVSQPNNENLAKKEEKTEYKGNPAFENTEILKVKVKLGENKYAFFKLKRFDDIFVTIQYFCEINNLDEEMIKPLIIKSLCAINTIYQVMNSKIDEKNIEVLKEIKDKK